MKYFNTKCRCVKYSLFALCVSILLLGCATIMHGTSQQIGVSSSPTGASVIIDNEPKGKTPITVDLSRKDNHMIRVEMEDYEPFEIKTTRSTSGWVWGNIVFGGLIGLAVDAITGGLYKINPEQIRAELEKKEGNSFLYQKDAIFITTVLKPDSDWERIGKLKPTEIK
jgi:uncharacterized protein YceK